VSGICGIFNRDGAPVDPDMLRKMAESAAHRGPDGIRYWTNGNVGFAHLALHVTPESVRERQPLLSSDGLVCLAADARVDNRQELIEVLGPRGYLREKDPTDADLILAAYSCWGAECPVHILGDFAFAVWDGRKQQIFCARDACGVKPLHYSRVNQTLCFASELQQILQNPEIPRRLDEVAMADHLTVNFYDQGSTMFLDVRRLPPAHRLTATRAGIRLKRYWDIDPSARTVYRRDEDYAAHFLHLFRRAVADHLRTRGKAVGITMSGGLDSCSIAAVSQHMLSANGDSPGLIAYSYAFDRLRDCDERGYSRAMADELGVEIEYIPAERFWFLREPVVLRPSLESPALWFESTTRHAMMRLRERGGRVLLTGEGGDSLLWGSPLIWADRLLQGHIGVLWDLARRAGRQGRPYHRLLYAQIARPLLPDCINQALRRLIGRNKPSRVPEWISLGFGRRIGLAERLAHPPVTRHFRNMARQDIYEFAITLGAGPGIYWYDNTAARFGLEARHPFWDRRLLEFILSIPPEQLFRGECRKLLLRRAMAGILPDVIRLRKDKTIFNSFADLSLRDKEADQVKGLLKAPLLGKMGIVDADRLRSAYERYRAGKKGNWALTLFPTIVLELWLKRYYDMFENSSCRKSRRVLTFAVSSSRVRRA